MGGTLKTVDSGRGGRSEPGSDRGGQAAADVQTVAFSAQVRGRVQRVGFRYSCRNEGRRLGLVGWVRNTPDGDVEVWAEGSREKLDLLLRWLRRGPPGARVDALDYNMHSATETYTDFGVEF